MSSTLSVVIPVRNDAARLGFLLGRLADLLDERRQELGRVEVIVVDDGSRDDTAAVARQLADAFDGLHLQTLPWPCGLGVALRSAIAHASGEHVVLIDVNRPLDLASIPFLVKMLEYADLVVSTGQEGVPPRSPDIAGRFVGAAQGLSRRLTASSRVELKAVRTETAKLVLALVGAPGADVGLQVSTVAASMGLRVLEMPVFWRQDRGRARRLDAGVSAALMWARTPRRPRATARGVEPELDTPEGEAQPFPRKPVPKKASG